MRESAVDRLSRAVAGAGKVEVGLPDGHTRAVSTDHAPATRSRAGRDAASEPEPLAALLRRRVADIDIEVRPLATYDQLATLSTEAGVEEVAS